MQKREKDEQRLYMRNKVDPADSIKGRRREGTEGSQCKDKEANSGNRIQKCGSTKEKEDKPVEKKTNESRDTRQLFNQIVQSNPKEQGEARSGDN